MTLTPGWSSIVPSSMLVCQVVLKELNTQTHTHKELISIFLKQFVYPVVRTCNNG